MDYIKISSKYFLSANMLSINFLRILHNMSYFIKLELIEVEGIVEKLDSQV